jgi:hypothetical protein
MSFDYNPYEHIELVRQEDGGWSPYCHSCGAELRSFLPSEPISSFVFEIGVHVLTSHKRDHEDFAGWGKF